MKFSNIIKEDLICILKSNNKNDAINELIDMVVLNSDFNNRELIRKEIFYREELMSTGIGLGLAIPHIRIENVKDFIIAIGVNKNGIDNYESIDGSKIKVIILIIVEKGKHREYIRLLAQIIKIFKNREIFNRVINADNSKEIFKVINEFPNI